MNKIRITESQAKRLGLLKEGIGNREFMIETKVSFDYYGVKLKGFEIDDINKSTMWVNYLIDMEVREWGIKNLSIYNIKGPDELNIDVSYWPNNDEVKEAFITLKLNWDLVRVEKNESSGLISLGNEVEIALINDAEGNLIVKEIVVQTYGV